MRASESTESDAKTVDGDSTAISWGPLRFLRLRSLILSGILLVFGLAWVGFDISVLGIMAIPLVLAVNLSVFLGLRGLEYTVNPDRATISTHIDWGDRMVTQQLRWAVAVRRVDLGTVSLFLFSNRGKRWYEGPHLLPVPTALSADVERLLQQMVAEQAPPPRIRRDVRTIVGGVGLSILGIGPLLYLLSGEFALLLLTTGPSAVIAPGLLLHSILG